MLELPLIYMWPKFALFCTQKHHIFCRQVPHELHIAVHSTLLCALHQIARLHIGMISMCESLDLPQWAVFVALHMSVSDLEREKIIKQILERAAPQLDGAISVPAFLQDELGIPAQWIHEALVR